MNPAPRACRCCGQIQTVPSVPAGMRAACMRCGTGFRRPVAARSAEAGAIALAALILYPVAVSLPIMQIEQFGHRTETSIMGGIATLLAGGNWAVAIIVLLCSIVFPLGKLFALLGLSLAGASLAHRHRATTYRLVEWTGRWGMMDVLLVAVLVAALKLGDVMTVTAGPAALAFATCVLLSILATARFDPHSPWEERA
jgi:paraquat-inducible protein A